ncbi:MAG: hypothetical protein HY906_26275 [Deltaproteobacteria bacterium]|nr:hypothetical protein [Deltaproteobacteria bacterium]
MPAPDVARLLADLSRALKKLRVRWYVFGAQAVVAAGVPRATADIDVTVDAPAVGPLVAALRRAGFVPADVGDLDTFLAQTRVIPLRHARSGFGLDVVLAGPGLEQEMLDRVTWRRVGAVRVPFVDTNDLVVLKVLAGRPKDLEDVAALVRSGSDELDLGVVRDRLAAVEALLDDSTLLRTLEGAAQSPLGPARRRRTRRPRR